MATAFLTLGQQGCQIMEKVIICVIIIMDDGGIRVARSAVEYRSRDRAGGPVENAGKVSLGPVFLFCSGTLGERVARRLSAVELDSWVGEDSVCLCYYRRSGGSVCIIREIDLA